jgi:hypothetical protein
MQGLFRLASAGRLTLLLGLLLTPALPAAQLPEAMVDFAPAVVASLRDRFGMDEMVVLRAAIVTAVARETQHINVPPGLTVMVTVRDVTPTHPTRRQQTSEPGIDPERTRFLGGADLAGVVRDTQGHVVADVMYRYYPPTLEMGSLKLDAWADAQVAIDQFAAKLGAACRRMVSNPGT